MDKRKRLELGVAGERYKPIYSVDRAKGEKKKKKRREKKRKQNKDSTKIKKAQFYKFLRSSMRLEEEKD